MFSRDVQVLNPGTSYKYYVTLHDKREYTDVIKDLRQGDYPDHPGVPDNVLIRGNRERHYDQREII